MRSLTQGRSSHVRLPKKKDFPAFTAYRSSSQSLSVNEIVKFDKIWTNNGDGYDPSSGVFTAPLAGLYRFAAVVMSVSDAVLYLSLYHNDAQITSSYLSDKGYKTGTFDVALTLEQGDKVSIRSRSKSQTIFSDGSNYCTFSGNLFAM
ncbi:cerebellin-3-like [Mytilus edulis]|uniref:cerebellin-3-like n=1 Tax=Mytilus edulis TaxID=6550 RepID=UPI0039EE74CC